MKNLRILEDHSPYYITFTFDGIENLIEECNKIVAGSEHLDMNSGITISERKEVVTVFNPDFELYMKNLLIYHIKPAGLDKIKSYLPWTTELDMPEWRGRIFRTAPHYKHVIHKDRANYGLNFMMTVQDDKCITSFYSDDGVEALNDKDRVEELRVLEHSAQWDKNGSRLRITSGVDDSTLVPIKTLIAQQGQGILFNTDIYHSWHNASDFHRTAIYMRPGPDDFNTFDFAKKELFGELLK